MLNDLPISSPPAQRLPSRRHDLRELLTLAWPMLIGQMAQVAMGVVDTVMAGAVGPNDLAAVAIGFSLWLPVYVFSIGILSAVTATVARAVGADDRIKQATTVQQGLWLALLLAAATLLFILHGHYLLPLMQVDSAVQPLSKIYLQGIALGVPAIMTFQVLRALSEGSGHSKPVMAIQIVALLSNVPLNYVFIHGLFGLPQLGGAGCGWATGCAMWLQVVLLGLLLQKRWRALLRLQKFAAPHWPALRGLLQLGVPIGAAMFAETSIFAGAALLIGRLGSTALAAHQIALNFSGMMFMVPMSLGLALTVKVSHALGAGASQRARRFAGLGAMTSIVFAAGSATLMLLFPYAIASIYSSDEAVRLLAVKILAYSASFQLFDGLQVTAVGSLRGYHDTRITMFITLIAYWGAGLPLGYLLGFTDLLLPARGVLGLWTGLIAGLAVAAILLNWRLERLSHRVALSERR